MNDYLTAAQLAERLQVSADTVRGWAKSGRIPEIRISPKVRRFDPVAVAQALNQHRATAPIGVNSLPVREAARVPTPAAG